MLDADWQFHLGDLPGNQAVTLDYNDGDWQHINVPHDYVLDGIYNRTNDEKHAYLPVEIGWYRKHLTIPASAQGKILRLDFDGVFRDSEVWLNGHCLGEHQSGFTPFSYDITPFAKIGADNIIAVRVDPTQFEGHWYEGGGIYRHVRLTVMSSLHLAQYGAYVISTVPEPDLVGQMASGAATSRSATANLTIQSTIENDQPQPANCQILSEIIAPDGELVASITNDATAPANSQTQIEQTATIQNPQLWSFQSPNLYQLRTTIVGPFGSRSSGHDRQWGSHSALTFSRDNRPAVVAGEHAQQPGDDSPSPGGEGRGEGGLSPAEARGSDIDSTTTTFGIRTIRYDPNNGFFLNGKHVEIQGTANHQDFAGVGIAMPDSLQPWRVQKLKAMGCNAWRTAHNPPSDALLDACDRLGMMVMDENRHLGDAYTGHSPHGTTATNLNDLATMILRDRNHPSIIMWSLCNEEGLRQRPEGQRLFAAMKQVVHRYDNSRPITCAINSDLLTNVISDEDIIGVNYRYRDYDKIHQANPRFPMFGSEANNQKTTRGEYAIADDRAAGMCSSYNLSDRTWLEQVNRPNICGSFTWTGFDYKGEPNPYGWPDVSNNTGLMDCCGFPKDKYYYFESCWSAIPMVHLLPTSWNWPGKEGQNIRVLAFSNAKQVELFLNGRSLGTKNMPHDDYAEWQVPYEPGQLIAKAYSNPQPNDPQTVVTDTIETTGAPTQIELTPDRTTLQANAEDAVVVPVSILDGKGRVVPDAANRVTFTLNVPVGQIASGAATQILGVSNGNPADHDTDKSNQRNAFHGHCMVLIQAGALLGTIQLTATAPGLSPAIESFTVK